MSNKLTYGEALDAMADGRVVLASQVQTKALRRKIWVSGNGSPGCLFDNGPNYHETKAAAIESCRAVFDEERGLVTALRKYHRFDCSTGEVCEISETTLGSVL